MLFDERVADNAANTQLLSAVMAAISELADRDREALLLFVWQNLSYAEIAEALEIPVGTVRSRLSRVRATLRASRTNPSSPGRTLPMSDPLDVVRDLAPPVDTEAELLERVRNDLMAAIDSSGLTKSPDSTHRQRRWVALIAAAVALTTATTTWAVTRNSSNSTTVECPTGIYAAVTGDPVLDCSNNWRRDNNSEPPAMAAYVNSRAGVVVLLATDTTPNGYAPLQPGVFQNTVLIELKLGSATTEAVLNQAAMEKRIHGTSPNGNLTGRISTSGRSLLTNPASPTVPICVHCSSLTPASRRYN